MENKIETQLLIAIQNYFSGIDIKEIGVRYDPKLKCNLYYVYVNATCYEITEMQVLAANKSWQYHKR